MLFPLYATPFRFMFSVCQIDIYVLSFTLFDMLWNVFFPLHATPFYVHVFYLPNRHLGFIFYIVFSPNNVELWNVVLYSTVTSFRFAFTFNETRLHVNKKRINLFKHFSGTNSKAMQNIKLKHS